MRTLLLIYFATFVQCDVYNGAVRFEHVRHGGGRTLIRHGRSRVHLSRMHVRKDERALERHLIAQDIEAERSNELGMF